MSAEEVLKRKGEWEIMIRLYIYKIEIDMRIEK